MNTEIKDKTFYDEETLKTLKSIEKYSKEQREYEKKRSLFSFISMISILCISAFLVIFCIRLSNKINNAYEEIRTSVGTINEIVENLSEVNFEKISEDLGVLIDDTESTIKTTNEKLSSVDFESLNEAITSLKNIVKPLADFFHR